MNICDEKKEVPVYNHPEFVPGHLYRNIKTGDLYIGIKLSSAKKEVLGMISNGHAWNSNEPFGDESDCYNKWEDVTDQYCLTKV